MSKSERKRYKKKKIARADCALFGRRKHGAREPASARDGDDDDNLLLIRMINRKVI